jgi:plastocyanin
MIAPVLVLSALAGTGPALLNPTLASTPASVDTTVISVYASSEGLAFDPTEIRARAGSIVKMRFVNSSPLPHNVIILLNEKDLDAIGAASFDAAGTGFVPMEHKAKMAGYSPLANAGKTVEFTFTVPPAGDYLFACFVDGHFNVMQGKLHSYKEK